MKVNTDGVLLGALCGAKNPSSILDIGTGTGVVALMLAQRFPESQITAIEIDTAAAKAAALNFENSPFAPRVCTVEGAFQTFSQTQPSAKFDLIVSNPPFFTNSLKNPDQQKRLARHTDFHFFDDLVQFVKKHLRDDGACYVILPPETAEYVIAAAHSRGLHLQYKMAVKSSVEKIQHRYIICLGFQKADPIYETFVIYQSEKVYTEQYRAALQNFLTIF